MTEAVFATSALRSSGTAAALGLAPSPNSASAMPALPPFAEATPARAMPSGLSDPSPSKASRMASVASSARPVTLRLGTPCA